MYGAQELRTPAMTILTYEIFKDLTEKFDVMGSF